MPTDNKTSTQAADAAVDAAVEQVLQETEATGAVPADLQQPVGNVANEPVAEFDFNNVTQPRLIPLGIQDEFSGKGGSYRINPQTGVRERVGD